MSASIDPDDEEVSADVTLNIPDQGDEGAEALVDPGATVASGSGANAIPAEAVGLEDAPSIPGVTLEAEIGRGGMGVVYRGVQTYLDRAVAVKLLLTRQGAGEFVARFEREAKILAQLTHSHIVACYDAGVTDDEDCFIVMEFVDGPDLREWLQANGPLPESRALQICAEMASALECAYEQGIIHRDVKPENVLLKFDERAGLDDPFPYRSKLADLGLARPEAASPDSVALTQQGAMLGTPSTMAPEQFDSPDGVDYRADIYGLGCVLFHSLTGSPAFPQRSLTEIVSAKLKAELPDPRELGGQISEASAQLVGELLARDPNERVGSYAELARRCREIAAGVAVMAPAKADARPREAAAPDAEASNTRRLRVQLGVGVALLTVVVFAAFVILRPSPGDEPSQGAQEPVAALPSAGVPGSIADVAIDVDVEGVADPEHGADAAGEQAPPQVVASAAEVDAPQQQDTGAEEGALGSAEVDPPADADPPGPRNLIEGSADSPLRGWGARMGSADWQLAKEGVLVGVGAGSAARALPLRGEWLFQGEICLEALPEGAPTPQGAGVLIELDGGHAMALRLMRLGPDVLLQVQRMFWDAELGDWAADDVRWQVDVELLEFEPGAEQAVAFKVAFQGEVLSFTWGANRPVPVPDELMGLEWPVSVGLFVNQERTRFSELMLEVLP